jgi:hypothetical protein
LEGARVSASFAASTQALTLEGGFSDDARQYFSGTHAEYEGDHYVTDGSGVRLPYLNEFYGPVANLSGSTFTVQGMSVNATGAYISGGTLQNGAYAEVKGSLVGNVIQAVRIEIKSGSSLTGNVGRFEIKGVVSSWAATSKTFVLTGAGGGVWTVDANSAYFEHGYPNNGNWVEIKAYIGTGNILVASKVEVKNNGWDD